MSNGGRDRERRVIEEATRVGAMSKREIKDARRAAEILSGTLYRVKFSNATANAAINGSERQARSIVTPVGDGWIWITNHKCGCLGCCMPTPFLMVIGPGMSTYLSQTEPVNWKDKDHDRRARNCALKTPHTCCVPTDIGPPAMLTPDRPCVRLELYQFMRHCCSEGCRERIESNRVAFGDVRDVFAYDDEGYVIAPHEVPASADDPHPSQCSLFGDVK